MTPIIASDFGNVGVFIIGVPTLVVAILVGVIGAVMRIQSVQIVAGIACWIIAGLFYWSLAALSATRSEDREFTIGTAAISAALGLLLLVVSRSRKK